jgi:hopene-associated glycosyltransferase HpnB
LFRDLAHLFATQGLASRRTSLVDAPKRLPRRQSSKRPRPVQLFVARFLEYAELFAEEAAWSESRRCDASVMAEVIAAFSLAVWLYLLTARGGFWLCRERDDWHSEALARWPRVAAVVPARNEADTIASSIGSLLAQDYPGSWTVILVDDDSSDGTGDTARRAAASAKAPGLLRVRTSNGLPAGWTGKLWAVKQGIDDAMALPQQPDYLLLTDADIVHSPDSLRRLVTQATAKGLVLTSLMAKLRCESIAERTSIPAFIFFFQMLYPFAMVNRAESKVAAAAGGCMLVRADALRGAGGIEIIRDALIDDCALARSLKRRGPIWLGLTERVRSIRSYPALADIRRMVVRSAYAQLRYSPLLLLGTVVAMVVTYLVPPIMAVFADGAARTLGIVTWVLMAIAFQPTLCFYRLSPLWGVALPVIAALYLLFTLDSAYQYVRGRGGTWKGRVQANVSE